MRRWIAILAAGLALLSGLAGAEPAGDDDRAPANDVELLEPPRPWYPGAAAAFGIEGACEVRFDLLAGGEIINITEVSCTNPVFCAAARRSVLASKSRVIDVPGSKRPGERANLVYPLEFKLSYGERDWPPGQPCVSDLVS